MYKYINEKQIIDILNKGRIGFVIRDIRTNDIEEYVNNCIITLGNEGFDTKILTQPKIFIDKTDNNSRNLIFVLNKSFNDTTTCQKTFTYFNKNIKILHNWLSKMTNAFTLDYYILDYCILRYL